MSIVLKRRGPQHCLARDVMQLANGVVLSRAFAFAFTLDQQTDKVGILCRAIPNSNQFSWLPHRQEHSCPRPAELAIQRCQRLGVCPLIQGVITESISVVQGIPRTHSRFIFDEKFQSGLGVPTAEARSDGVELLQSRTSITVGTEQADKQLQSFRSATSDANIFDSYCQWRSHKPCGYPWPEQDVGVQSHSCLGNSQCSLVEKAERCSCGT
jgi:hypothetical protein